jgi:ATP-binding cassette, subfamily B, bacterial CvaB/MchF/RaxB
MDSGTVAKHCREAIGQRMNNIFGPRLPSLLQTESAECGITCLAMVAQFYGHDIDLITLRKRHPVSIKGSTLPNLISIAGDLGLRSRALRAELEHLKDLALPCILHWNLNHFVVLKSVQRDRVTIHDPAVGVRTMALKEAGKHFTGVLLELKTTDGFEKVRERQSYRLLDLMGNVDGLKRTGIQLFLVGLAIEVTAILAPLYIQWLIDQALISNDRNLVAVLGIGFVLLTVFQSGMRASSGWIVSVVSTSVNFQWLGNVYSHLLRLPVGFFERRHLGDVVSRFGSVSAIQKTITTDFVQTVLDGLLVVGTFAMMLLYSPLLAIVSLVSVGLYLLIKIIAFRPLRDSLSEYITHAAKQQSHFLETVRGIQTVKLFARGSERYSGWMNQVAEQFHVDLRIKKIGIYSQLGNSLSFGIERIVVIWLGILAVLDAKFTVGMVFAFIAYRDQFSTRVTSLIDKLFEFRMLRLHGERLADIVLAEPEKVTSQNDISPEALQSDISISNLHYRYSANEPFVLAGVNLEIKDGDFVAITGPSGCGKTTLVKLILGLLEETDGEVRMGDVPIRRIGMDAYRNLVGAVMQDDNLFSGSLADNICFFDPIVDFDQIVSCARMASIHEEILRMPMGYNTLVGDVGTGLSGGQKQRILLARALYRKPRILVLDEATSHLDIESERSVNGAIKQLQLTRIIVAHRPDTIAMANRVVDLREGKVARDQVATGQ